MAKTGSQVRFIRVGRPRSNGCVERVQRPVLEECWRPTIARSLVPKYSALRRDLVHYLRTPAELVYGVRKIRPPWAPTVSTSRALLMLESPAIRRSRDQASLVGRRAWSRCASHAAAASTLSIMARPGLIQADTGSRRRVL